MQEHFIELPFDMQFKMAEAVEKDVPDACPLLPTSLDVPPADIEYEIESLTKTLYQPRGRVICSEPVVGNRVCGGCKLKTGVIVTLENTFTN